MAMGTTDDGLQALLADLRAGAVDRREFIRRAGAAGMSLAAIAGLVRSAAAQATPVASSADAATAGDAAATPLPGSAGDVAGAAPGEGAGASSEVRFFLNGRAVALADPSPDLLLVDWLRSPEIGLAGPKIGCGQGGCGACTVIVSDRDADGNLRHRAINSCLRPVASLGGAAVTTVEGTGSATRPPSATLSHAAVGARIELPAGAASAPELDRAAGAAADARAARAAASAASAAAPLAVDLSVPPDAYPTDPAPGGMNPVAYRLAVNNGSQCGYCSAGFVMNMTEFLANTPDATQREIEAALDGNICRCTGYRAILAAMKTFASDWSELDEAGRMVCDLEDGLSEHQLVGPLRIPAPASVAAPAPTPIPAAPGPDGAAARWLAPATLEELGAVLAANRDRRVRLVHGNTGFGVYPEEYVDAGLHVDIRAIPDLHVAPEVSADAVRVGAGTTYTDLLAVLDAAMAAAGEGEHTRLGAARHMARRTAGRILRNAATLGGNAMLVLRHIASGTGDSFPSDLFTALAGIGATVEYATFDDAGVPRRGEDSAIGLAEAVADGRIDPERLLIVAFRLPRGGANDVAVAQKVAMREVNAHSIVNATTLLELAADGTVKAAAVVLGGIAPYPWRAAETERFLLGRTLALEDAAAACGALAGEVAAAQRRWAARAAENVYEGFTAEYRADLATGFLYKALVNALAARGLAPAEVATAGEIAWGNWPVSGGAQRWSPSPLPAPIGRPFIKNTAMYQTSGQIRYTHEQPTPRLTLEGAFVQSARALARFALRAPGDGSADRAAAYVRLREHLTDRFPGFVDLVTSDHFPAMGINRDAWALDQPILAEDEVRYPGQAMALALALTSGEATRIAAYVGEACVAWSPIGWPAPFDAPVLGIDRAAAIGSLFPDSPASAPYLDHVWRVERLGGDFSWAGPGGPSAGEPSRRETLDGAACIVLEGSQRTGGQAHFYLETQAAIAEPLDLDRMRIVSSTQSPGMIHSAAAMALGLRANQVEVEVPLVGGGFGGKTVQSRGVAAAAAVAAAATGLPVRVLLPRDADTAMIGKRHAVRGSYRIAVDAGEADPADRGVIRGLDLDYLTDGGAYYDASFTVATNLVLRADNYRVANWRATVDVCRTNAAPSTAFRAFGDVQGKNVGEAAVDDAAFALGMTAEEVREKNLYRRGDTTPSGQPLTYCYMPQVWEYLKAQSRYAERRAAVEAFNAANRWRKRGIAMVPVKYGSGYNLELLEQATALVAVSSGDGTVTVQQGGVEMGQGLLTYSQQVAAATLNVPIDDVLVVTSSTGVLPDPTGTGSSIGTPYYAEAVKRTCQQLRDRLTAFGLAMRDDRGEAWCTERGIDFWNHAEGWAARAGSGRRTIWQNLVGLARSERESLVETFTAKVRGGEMPVQVTYKPASEQRAIPGIPLAKDADIGGEVDAFPAFTYSAACAVAEVDVLTGEVKILSADIVYDMGFSVNPALDIGQVEGGFIQGVGYLLSEELVFQPDGEEVGRLNTTNTWRYKPPAAQSIPLEMNVWLFPRDDPSVRDVPADGNQILSAKEVGEPPLVLANSVFFAVKQAVRASRLERGLDGIFRLDAPATPQEVRRACAVSLDDLGA